MAFGLAVINLNFVQESEEGGTEGGKREEGEGRREERGGRSGAGRGEEEGERGEGGGEEEEVGEGRGKEEMERRRWKNNESKRSGNQVKLPAINRRSAVYIPTNNCLHSSQHKEKLTYCLTVH